MTWTPITREQVEFGQQVVLWIKTARGTGSFGYGTDWLPSIADFTKSALFERIRSGKKPLDNPPPRGMACPWYAVVEDAGPHYLFEVHTKCAAVLSKPDDGEPIIALQNAYVITSKRGESDFIVRDGHHRKDTGYRFRMWLDADWTHPSGHYPKGGWFMQNMDFVD